MEETKTSPNTKYKPDVELAISIIARHNRIYENQLKYTKQARDEIRRQARAQSIEVPIWESHWKELDEWKDLIAQHNLEEEPSNFDLAPPPLTPPPTRTLKPFERRGNS